MKKFLSLLLALTMVLSLTVVPARATENELTWGTEPSFASYTSSIAKGATLTLTVNAPVVKKGDETAVLDTDYTLSYTWTGLPSGVTGNGATATGTVSTADTYNQIKCTVVVSAKEGTNLTGSPSKELTASVTVTDPEVTFKDAVKNNITYNGRPCTYTSADNKITYYTLSGSETPTNPQWAASATGYTNVTASLDNSTLTVKGTPNGGSEITTTFTTELANASFTANASISEVITGGQVTLTASNLKGFNNATYTWYYGDASSQVTPCIMSGNVWTVPSNITSSTNYTVKGVATVNGVEAATATTTVKVIPNTFTIKVTANPPAVSSTTTPVTVTAKMYNGQTEVTDSAISNWRLDRKSVV